MPLLPVDVEVIVTHEALLSAIKDAREQEPCA
jgi:hypothetical protein